MAPQQLQAHHEGLFSDDLVEVQTLMNRCILSRGARNLMLGGFSSPSGLQQLTFGRDFNKVWTTCAFRVASQQFTFGNNFNQGLDNLRLPSGLPQLTFGDDFNQRLENVSFPCGLQQLALGSISTRVWRM